MSSKSFKVVGKHLIDVGNSYFQERYNCKKGKISMSL